MPKYTQQNALKLPKKEMLWSKKVLSKRNYKVIEKKGDEREVREVKGLVRKMIKQHRTWST